MAWLSTYNPTYEIFAKGYRAPKTTKTREETAAIKMPATFFTGLPVRVPKKRKTIRLKTIGRGMKRAAEHRMKEIRDAIIGEYQM